MNRFAGKKYQFFKAMTVVVIASFACWALAQQSDQSRTNEKQIKRINTLEELGKHEEALFWADSLMNDFKSRDLRPEWYDVLREKTIKQNIHEERPEAIAQLQAIMHAETLNDSITAKIYGLLGYLFLYEDDYEMGARYYEKALAGLLSNNCKSGLGTAYMNLGYALKSQGNYRVAIPYYLTSLPLLKKEG
ncbi:MAG TPA: tetratricopeptide repeat protein, partial [Saprospiraceae bacterium]|nr:tetratricopeptide repeat protein [Saprospiraceae bacterium]HPI06618.1 tetratricopeptide repeat protein [Saprospiraceae bacterium]